MSLQRQLLGDDPSSAPGPYIVAAAFYEWRLAGFRGRQGRHAEARGLLEAPVGRLERLASDTRTKPHIRDLLARCYGALADEAQLSGADRQAREVRDKLAALGRPMPRTQPAGEHPRH